MRDSVVEAVNGMANFLEVNILADTYAPFNAFFSGSVKTTSLVPYFFPSNVMQYYNGTEIPRNTSCTCSRLVQPCFGPMLIGPLSTGRSSTQQSIHHLRCERSDSRRRVRTDAPRAMVSPFFFFFCCCSHNISSLHSLLWLVASRGVVQFLIRTLLTIKDSRLN